MKVLLLIALFNIHTGQIHDVTVKNTYSANTAWHDCAQDLINQGIQIPDKNGDVKIFECITPGDKITMQGVENL